jgi:asparagine synthase (glutamine-hydrolysing)
MCGIAGFFATATLNDDARLRVESMVDVMRHRGPDGSGFHIDLKTRLAMGHGRLSIIDLDGGSQPLKRTSPHLVLTVNGEFYDYKRIRTHLNCSGERFATKSDSEIALHLYKRHGLGFVEHLRGEFAFALFDEAEDRLILVRDRFGIKPLFYHVGRDTIYYGSEVKALLAHPDVPRDLDPKATLHQLMHTMIPGTSAFRDISAVKPGHMVIVQRRGMSLDVSERCYWDMEFPAQDDHERHRTADEYIECVREALIESVSLRLEADVPVGCYLSGGIDSCSMLGIASSVQQSPVKAFTISFDHDAYDESGIAREMARRVNADQEVLSLGADDLYGENYLRTIWHAERTFYNTLGVAKWCMSRRVRESGYKTVVTGEGADEMFGGYPAFKRDMLLHGSGHGGSRAAHEHQKRMDESNKLFRGAILAEQPVSHPAFESLCGFTPSWIQPWLHTLELARPLLHDDLKHELRDYDPAEGIATSLDPDRIDDRHPLDIAQYTWIKTMLECQILNWGGDRVDMANSMESRPAFLDHTVAEVARHIPPHMRINGNTEKWILREAMKDVLPEVLYTREKFAFMAPPGHTDEKKQKALNDMLEQHMSDDEIRKAGIFDVKRLRTFVEDYRRDTDSVSLVRKDALVNHLLCLHVLHQQYVQKTCQPATAVA